MDNIQYLENNIDQVETLIADTEERMTAGEEWLDAQLDTIKRHRKDLRKQLAEAMQPELVG
jgi:predicted  nucleic acid-binding Zn-ribbon protein